MIVVNLFFQLKIDHRFDALTRSVALAFQAGTGFAELMPLNWANGLRRFNPTLSLSWSEPEAILTP